MRIFGKIVRMVVLVVPWLWTTGWAATNTIQVFNFDFGTAPATHVDPIINVGDTVAWVWASGATGHSTTTPAGQTESWDSGVHTQPNTFTHTFTNAGTFNYYCAVHGFDAGGGAVGGMSGHVVVQASGGTIYFDDFNQFANGTVLTGTNYFPNLGTDATVKTNDNGGATTTMVASNLLGSIRAFYRLGTPPYQAGYRGGPTVTPLVNQSLTLSFKLWIEATKNSSHIGGIGLNVTTTNIDFINGTQTNYNNNPLIFINDGGQVYAFTNDVSTGLNPLQIGSWASQAGKVMTNVLAIDYPGGTYSFSLNGNTLTNLPIPGFVTNVYDRVRIDVFEDLANSGTLNSLGNRFALDDVKLTGGAASTNRDVTSFIAGAKGQLFEQLTAGTPSMLSTGFAFHADVRGIESNSIVAASVKVPGGADKALTRDYPGSSQLEFNDAYTTKNALDSAYNGNATYTITIDGQNQGTLMAALHLPADAYPTTPQIANFTAAQAINSATNFVVHWNAFSGGTSSDFITLSVDDSQGTSFFGTPDAFEPGALGGTATSATIPGGTLLPGTSYVGRLLFIKASTLDTNSIPGVSGGAGYFKETTFILATVAGPGATCILTPALATNDVGTTYNGTATLTTNGIAVAGVTINFDVIAGPNTGTSGSDTTDAGGHASFSYSSLVTGTDTIQAAGAFSSLAFTTTATAVWLAPNVPPVAVCRDVTVATSTGCQANVTASQVDNISTDSDGIIVSRTLSPAGPYGLGNTPVTLTVTDNRGGMDSCTATITVLDQTLPTISCPSNIVVTILAGQTNAVVNFPAPVASDNCSITSLSCTPASGSTFPLGTNLVTCTAVDGSENTNTCTFTITIRPAQANLGITKTDSPDPVFVGSNLTYTVTVRNNGPDNATGVTMVDVLPASVGFISAIPNQGTCTQIAGTVTCDLGSLANNGTAVVTILTVASATGEPINTATVTANEVDPNPLNNSASEATTILPVPHDLAVVKLKAPKKITLSATATNVVGTFGVSIQNRGPGTEVIPNFATLSNLVTISIQSLSNCPSFKATMRLPKATFPITLASKQKLNLSFTADFSCINDVLSTSKTEAHNDYSVTATVHHEAIDGRADTFPGDDTCPRGPLNNVPLGTGTIADKGCGGKNPDGTLGAPVFIDLIMK